MPLDNFQLKMGLTQKYYAAIENSLSRRNGNPWQDYEGQEVCLVGRSLLSESQIPAEQT